MPASMNIVCVDPRTDSLWQRLVEQTPSSVFHSPGWMRVLTDTYGWEPRAYVLLDDQGQPCGGIPFFKIVDMLGERIVSLPFSDYCDPLVKDAQDWRSLVDLFLCEDCPIALRCLHNALPLADERFGVVKEAKWHGLDLGPEAEALWQGMEDSTHRAIKKSQREGVVVRVAQSEEDLRAFFEMHLKVRKYKLGLLAQPFQFFQNIWRHFVEPGNGFILLAIYNDRIVAADFFLVWKETLYYKFNASHSDGLSHRPNDLLIWEGIQQGRNRGLKLLDFGLSDIDQEGLVRYKRKFGTEEKTISFLKYAPNGSPTAAEKELRELLNQMSQRFTDHLVPDPVTEKAGEALYRLFT